MYYFAILFMALPLWAETPENIYKNQYIQNEFERVPDWEAEAITKMRLEMEKQITLFRDAHARAHGCVDGIKVKVLRHLPKDLQVGFFEADAEFDAIARFSPGSDDVKSTDQEGGGQGFALKMALKPDQIKKLVPLFAETKFYLDEKYYKTFDILTISRVNEFFVNRAEDYNDFTRAKGMAKGTAKLAILAGKKPHEIGALVLQTFDDNYFRIKGKPAREKERVLFLKLAAARPKNILLEEFGSWVPSLYGDKAVKYRITRVDKSEGNPDDFKVDPRVADIQKDPAFLSKVLASELTKKPHHYKLQVQFHKAGFPSVEDAAHAWPEDQSAYVDIATIEIPQKAEPASALMNKTTCEIASFHPAHTSREHFPIGSVQRARVGGEKYEGIYTAIHRVRNENRLKDEAKKK